MRKGLVAQIQDDDPSYDPLALACQEAGIKPKVFDAALDRVIFDGFYGPVSTEDWREQDGREPASIAEARHIVHEVAFAVQDYKQTHLEMCEDPRCGGWDWDEEDPERSGESHEHEIEERVEADALRRDLFRHVYEIYGFIPD
jgi:hypothetical protein